MLFNAFLQDLNLCCIHPLYALEDFSHYAVFTTYLLCCLKKGISQCSFECIALRWIDKRCVANELFSHSNRVCCIQHSISEISVHPYTFMDKFNIQIVPFCGRRRNGFKTWILPTLTLFLEIIKHHRFWFPQEYRSCMYTFVLITKGTSDCCV